MGYHTAAEIPNYWAYAKHFVLHDHMFEPVKSWSLPDHLYMVSAWSARCRTRSPMSCVNDIVGPYGVNQFDEAVHNELVDGQTSIDLAWTDITWLLHARHVSWEYYIETGTQPDCDDDSAETCAPVRRAPRTPGSGTRCRCSATCSKTTSWATSAARLLLPRAAKAGTLPSVSWIIPSGATASTRRPACTRGRPTSPRSSTPS